jgi:integrase
MPGHIRKKNNRYRLRIYVGHGKKRDFYYRTDQEAQAAQVELAHHVWAHSSGLGIAGDPKERLERYLRDWIERRRPALSVKTAERYNAMIGRIATDPIGSMLLHRVSSRALESFYARLQDQGLSGTTAHHYHRFLHKCLRDAERIELIRQNPAHLVEGPRRTTARPGIWTEAQTHLFLSEARTSSQHYPLYLFLAATGCRLGEALALKWDAVNLAEAEVVIRFSLVRPHGGGYVLKVPKTRTSERVVGIPAEMVECLRALPRRSEFVFTRRDGGPLHAGNLRRRDLRKLWEKRPDGLPSPLEGMSWTRALHNLRHFHASYLLQRGANVRAVSARLGHANASVTLNTYSHLLRQRDSTTTLIGEFLAAREETRATKEQAPQIPPSLTGWKRVEP